MSSLPVPAIHSWDDGVDNLISAPYIIMDAAKGSPSAWVWRDRVHSDISEDEQSSRYEELLKVRRNFLKSLAKTLSGLQGYMFDKIGVLELDDQSWNDPDVADHRYSYYTNSEGNQDLIPAFKSSSDYWDHHLRKFSDFKDLTPEEANRWRGMGKLYSLIFKSPPFNSSKWGNDEEETFPLMHTDINLQNIFTDSEGNITGIIDWDGVRTSPRCSGPASVPIFLRIDWTDGYTLANAALMPSELKHYRKVYAEYMTAAYGSDGQGDGKFTEKSAMYHVAYDGVLHMGECHEAFVQRPFKEVDALMAFDPDEFLETIGTEDGSSAAKLGETLLENAIAELFKI
jgi:hypothetical protein